MTMQDYPVANQKLVPRTIKLGYTLKPDIELEGNAEPSSLLAASPSFLESADSIAKRMERALIARAIEDCTSVPRIGQILIHQS